MSEERDWTKDFDHTDPAYARDMWDVARQLRAACPVARGQAFGGFRVISRFSDVRGIYRDTEHFTSREGVTLPSVNNPFPALPNETDGEEHRAYRALIMRWLSPEPVARMEPALRSLVDEHLDTFAGRGHCDFVTEFSYPLPAAVISMVMGLPRSEWREVKDRFSTIVQGTNDRDEDTVKAGWEGLIGYLREQIEDRRRQPRDDLVTELTRAKAMDQPLTDDQVLGLVFTLVTAGQDTTSNTMGMLTKLLAEQPEIRTRLIDKPALIPEAIEEMLRWWGPAQTIGRTAAADTEIAGCPIRKGEKLALLLGSANRDDSVFENGDTFDLDRKNKRRHIAFGNGEHICAGVHLARLELRIVFERLLARIPDFELAGKPVVCFPGGIVYGLSSLPLRFTPEARARVRFRPASAEPPSIVGPYSVNTLIAGAQTDGALSVIEYSAGDASAPEEPHALSREDAAIVMLDGSATFEADGESHQLSAGASLFVARGVKMRRVSVDRAPARYLIIFVPGGFDRFFVESAELVSRRLAAGESMDQIMPEVRKIQAQFGIV